jgi:hypothetical protein
MTTEIRLISTEERNIIEPFENWRRSAKDNEKHLIACIPFVRNLIDFKDGQDDNYKYLTHVLHKKLQNGTIKATTDIAISDLQPAFSSVLSDVLFAFPDTNKKLIDIIEEQIIVIKDPNNANSPLLEDKIILAIGTRLKAEEYMWSKVTIQDQINGSQTGKLFQRYKNQFDTDNDHKEIIRTLESVIIMTPENIHLNSFMYEPILDMSTDELKNLHTNVCKLLTD